MAIEVAKKPVYIGGFPKDEQIRCLTQCPIGRRSGTVCSLAQKENGTGKSPQAEEMQGVPPDCYNRYA